MYSRPISVGIVGWFLVMVGILLLVGALAYLSKESDVGLDQTVHPDKVAITVRFGIEIFTGGLIIICGVNILNGANWARWLYTCCSVLNLVLGIVFVDNKLVLLIPFVLQAIIITVLFLPAANEFFSPREY